MKRWNTAGGDWIKILVGDGVPPIDEFLKQFAPTLVSGIQRIDFPPKVDSKTIEIRTDRAGMWISSTEATVPDELAVENCM